MVRVNQKAYGRQDESPPTYSASVDVVAPNTSGALHVLLIGCGVTMGDLGITYNWEFKNQTDGIVIDSGTVNPATCLPSDVPIWLTDKRCRHQNQCLRHIDYGAVPLQRELSLSYQIYEEWRGKTFRLTITDPTETNTKTIRAQMQIITSVDQ